MVSLVQSGKYCDIDSADTKTNGYHAIEVTSE